MVNLVSLIVARGHASTVAWGFSEQQVIIHYGFRQSSPGNVENCRSGLEQPLILPGSTGKFLNEAFTKRKDSRVSGQNTGLKIVEDYCAC